MSKFLAVFIFLLFSCCKTTNNISKFKKLKDSINLYAFIGEKVSVVEFDPNNPKLYRIEIDSISKDSIRYEKFIMDNGFNCKYKVLKNVFNELNTDTIEFKSYDHYGRPGFENYENVMLYLSISSDSTHYFHQKYQFDPVKKSKEGIWTGLNEESIEELFKTKKNEVFTKKGMFD